VPDLPDFHIPHAEKIEWMIETRGWAVEPVPARSDTDPPFPGYLYSIGLPAAISFPEVVVFGLTPAAANGLIELVVEIAGSETEVPIGTELTGMFDGDLRGVFAPVDMGQWSPLFATAVAWYKGEPFEVVQLLWPDRNGWLPYEPGFDERVRYAQPVIGRVG